MFLARCCAAQTLEDLKREIANGSVKLSHEQQVGLQYLEAFEKRIPRAEVCHVLCLPCLPTHRAFFADVAS